MQTLNISSYSTDPRAKMLSPLRNRPFKFEGQWYSSFEGFYAGIKYPEGSDNRNEAFVSSFGPAQTLGINAPGLHAWWKGTVMDLGSEEHLILVKAAHWASIIGNSERRNALIATGNLHLTHIVETGADPHYSPEQFCADLMELRANLPTIPIKRPR